MKRLQKLIWWLPCLLNTFFFCNLEGHGFIYTVILVSFSIIASVMTIATVIENKDVTDFDKKMSNYFGIIGVILFLLDWNFAASISLFWCAIGRTFNPEEENNNKEIKTNYMIKKEKTLSETDITNTIYQLCLEYGFIEKYGELKIYDPTEKDKDVLFDEVFSIIVLANKGWFDGITEDKENLSYITRCVQNIRTGEEITVIIPIIENGYIKVFNKIDKSAIVIEYALFSNNLCYSKREIEKVEIEKQIAKLNIPKYVGLQFNVYDNTLHFYVEYKEVEDLTIKRKELSKEKILQHIAKCKKRYKQKYENSNTIRKEIQDLFNV